VVPNGSKTSEDEASPLSIFRTDNRSKTTTY
jgi:hypothetical protein